MITGAADDDPSGIATYSIAGAQMGTSLLWTAFITWPLMGCVQFMCARIGMVTGIGLAAALKQKFPRWVLFIFALALFAANTMNVGSDLAGMSDAAEMLTGFNSHWFVEDFEMAGAVSLCLCHNGFCGRTRLAHRSARHVHLPFKSAHYFYGVREIRRASKFSRLVNYFPLFAIS
ncbi:MAG: hypothetical protein DME46_03940, partial [Verrucomicrobia bacterium]